MPAPMAVGLGVLCPLCPAVLAWGAEGQLRVLGSAGAPPLQQGWALGGAGHWEH